MKSSLFAAATFAAVAISAPAQAETTLCTEITSLPFTITTQGVYCLKQNLNVNLESGNAITVNAGNVIIDFNDFRVNNQAPLATNLGIGVFARDRKNVTLRNGFIRGFSRGVYFDEAAANASSSHLVEGMKVADSGFIGIHVKGDKSAIRNNVVLDTGGGPDTNAYGISLNLVDDGFVADNIITGVSETNENNGIFVYASSRVRITGNEITRVDGAFSDYAIRLVSVGRAITSGNKLLNDPATGTGGIVDSSSTNIACRDNEAGGFSATPFSGCDVNVGNVIDFN